MHTIQRDEREKERDEERERKRERESFVYFGLVWFVCMYALLVLCVIFFFGNKRDRRYKRGVKGRKSKKDIKGLRVFFSPISGVNNFYGW